MLNWCLLYTLGFGLIHWLAYRSGLHFDAELLGCMWQLLDPWLLKHDLWRSVLLLHGQPPLFNVLVGLVLQLADSQQVLTFQVLFLGFGFLTGLALFFVLDFFQLRRWLSMLLVWLWVSSPQFLMYEHLLFYSVLEVCLLACAFFCLTRFYLSDAAFWLFSFFMLLAALCLTRSLFHLGFLVCVFGWIWVAQPHQRLQVFLCGLLPIALVGAWYVKNFILFGFFGASSWLGMNLANNLGAFVPKAIYEQHKGQELSEWTKRKAFQPLEYYKLKSPPEESRAAHAALITERKKISSGAGPAQCDVNFNHEGYRRVAGLFLKEGLAIAKLAPRAWLERTALAWWYFLWPATRYQRLENNRPALAAWVEIWERYLLARVQLAGPPAIDDKPQAVYLTVVLGVPFLFLVALRLWRRGEFGILSFAQTEVLGFGLFCILYMSILGNLVEMPENNRFRFSTEPFFLVLLGILIERTAACFSSREG
jgi:hypothetical protein